MPDYRCIISSIEKPKLFFGVRFSVVVLAFKGEDVGVCAPFTNSVSLEWHFICVFKADFCENVSGHTVH